MATGQDIVNGALRKLGYKSADSAITGQELLDGVEDLNDLLSEYEKKGLLMGFSRIADPADTVRIPAGSEGPIKLMLMGRLASDYSKQLTPTQATAINDAEKSFLMIIKQPLDVEYPDTLPLGAGNDGIDVADQQRFFANNNEENF